MTLTRQSNRARQSMAGCKAGGLVATVATLLTMVAVAGCGGGELSRNGTPYDGSGGVNGSIGEIELRDAQIQYPGDPRAAEYAPGQDAALRLTIVNTGDRADRLVEVSSPVAAAAEIRGEATLPPDGSLTAGMDGPVAAVEAPWERTIAVVLVNLRKPLRSGINYPVAFTFERGGTLWADLPLENPSEFCTRVPGATVCVDEGASR